MGRDFVAVEGLQVQCIVGIHGHERETPQSLIVDVRLGLDLADAGHSGRICDTCDYAQIATEVQALLQHRRYKLLENAAEEVAAMIFGVHPPIAEVQLRIAKPQAIQDALAAVVEIARSRSDIEVRREEARFGEVEVLLETREAGLYLLHVDAGRTIPLHHHRVMSELEWVIAGELYQDGVVVPLCVPREWKHGERHGYDNRSDERATIFCCDTPPFIHDDEIEQEPRSLC